MFSGKSLTTGSAGLVSTTASVVSVLVTVVKMGTPYVQVIPFKRVSWKMEIGESKQYRTLELFKFHQKYIHKYKNWFWRKKSWK